MKARFTQIKDYLLENIYVSKKSIYIAVAWFTNKELLTALTDKAKEGVDIKILISNDIINQRLNHNSFIKTPTGKLMILSGDKFLHEKFSLFDNEKLLIGSYNWTYGAEYMNYESIIETSDTTLLQQYNIRFNKLWGKAFEFEVNSFTSKKSDGFILQEEVFQKLEKELEDDILKTLEELKQLKVPISHTIVLDMIHRYGAVGTCKKVLEKGNDDQNIPSGFTKLVEANKMDQSFEYLMTRDKYRILFNDHTLKLAQERLEKFSR